jgi:hypothetical protein
VSTTRRRVEWLPPAIVAVTALTIAVGLTAKAAGVHWRTPAQPLVLFYRPELSPWALGAAIVLPASLWAAWRLFRSQVGPVGFGLALLGLTLATRVALNMARGGPGELYEVFAVHNGGEGRTEYLPALTQLRHGGGFLLTHFADLIPVLPVHAAGNPPGLLLTMNALGIDTAQGLAALTIVVGALATPLLYALGRRLLGEQSGRIAALLFVFVPTSLLYGATSADAMYVSFGLLAAVLLVSRRRAGLLAGALALAVASFFSYALLAVGAWAAILRWRREGLAAALRLALLCGAVLAGSYLVLDLLSGFNLVEVLRVTNDRYHDGIANVRPYLFYLFGSPAAFVLMLGPVAWFAGRALGAGEDTAIAIALVVAVAAIGGYTKGETERIWIFLVPFVCLAAARFVRVERVPVLLGALTLQAVVIQVLLSTKW